MKTPGDQISAALLERPEQRRFHITLERKAGPILAVPGTYDTVPAVVPGPNLPLRLRSLIPAGRTVGAGITYLRETSITSSPVVPVAPGALKPLLDMTYESQQKPVITIPGYLKASKQAWEDFAMFQSWIDARLYYALALGEEKELLTGSGVLPHLEGLMTVAIAATTVAGSGGTAVLDNVAAGMGALYARGYVPTGVVLNPADWGKVATAKTVGGPYVAGDPAAAAASSPTLWGVPVVLAPSMAVGSYLVGQFNPYCQIFDREDAAVEVADQNQDDFVKNLLTVRIEERLAFAIYQPGAFAKGTFTP
jgi:HK97 family phage major capsid protein